MTVRDRDIIRVGNHLIACGDIERNDGEQLLFRYGMPDLIYVDPPWGAGHYRFWHNHAKMPKEVYDYDRFLHLLARMFDLCTGEVFIEIGLRWEELLVQKCQAFGGHMKGRWLITYHTTRPCLLFHFSFNDRLKNSKINFSGHDDRETPRMAIKNYSKEGEIIFDPCIGKGTTAVAAHKLGRICYGLELNPKRATITINKLAALSKADIERVASLQRNWTP